ncbi:MAG: ribose 1,5-bisphosphate isomerase [Thermoplasmatota archaeon]
MKEEKMEGLSLEEIADKIKSMEIRGAAKIGRAAARGLKNSVSRYDQEDIGELKELIREGKKRLKSTRPTAVSLQNAIRYVLKGSSKDVEERKRMVINRADEFIYKSINAGEKIAEYGGRRIRDGDIILTHCNSSMALGCIKYAWDEVKDIQVIATESRPKRQGYITVRELADHGVPVMLIVDSAVRHKMTDVDKVYVGADTIASNGAVINKIGTSQVALCAHEARVPVTVCAETYKFSSGTAFGDLIEIEERDPKEIVDPDEFSGVDISNPVFDATPSKYIDSIITEEGVISPSYAYKIIKEMEE